MSLQKGDGSARRQGEPAYRLVRKFQDGANNFFVVAWCARCNREQQFHWSAGDVPALIGKKFHELGWDFATHRPRKCICNICKGKGKPVDNVTQMIARQHQPRVLTAAERSKVRRLLDDFFDGEAGRYIDNYSDQRIGTELDVPWSRVAEMRELAYGSIREDPRLDQLRNELNDLKARARVAESKLTENLNDLNGRIAKAEAALADIVKSS